MPPIAHPGFEYDFDANNELANIRAHQQHRGIPARTVDNLLIASWNLCNLGDSAQPREARNLQVMAEIMRPFDLIAVQEIKDDFRQFIDLMSWMSPGIWEAGVTFLTTGAYLNLVLAIFNLIPIPPLDGSSILASFHPGYRRLIGEPRFAMIGMLLFLLVFFNAGHVVFGVARDLARFGIQSLRAVIPGDGRAVGVRTAVREPESDLAMWLDSEFSDDELVRVLGATPAQVMRLREGRLSDDEARVLISRYREAGVASDSAAPRP